MNSSDSWKVVFLIRPITGVVVSAIDTSQQREYQQRQKNTNQAIAKMKSTYNKECSNISLKKNSD